MIFSLSLINNKIKSIDLKNEKKDYENQKCDYEKTLEELTEHLNEENPFDIEAKFSGYIPNPDFLNKKKVILRSNTPRASTQQIFSVPAQNITPRNSNFNMPESGVPKIEKMFDHSFDLTEQQWFHGILSRSQSEELLIEDGDFLVRVSFSYYLIKSGPFYHKVFK